MGAVPAREGNWGAASSRDSFVAERAPNKSLGNPELSGVYTSDPNLPTKIMN